MLYYLNAELMGRRRQRDVALPQRIALCLLFWSIDEGTTQIDPETGEILGTRWRADIERMRDGLEWGSMDLTEPHLGATSPTTQPRQERTATGL